LSDRRSGVLLVRVWLEDDDTFRARVTAPPLASEGGEPAEDVTVAVGSSPREVLDAVGKWLDGFLSGARTD
jgi:hypothetical protein